VGPRSQRAVSHTREEHVRVSDIERCERVLTDYLS